jgi:hypothetical protein
MKRREVAAPAGPRKPGRAPATCLSGKKQAIFQDGRLRPREQTAFRERLQCVAAISGPLWNRRVTGALRL